MKSHILWGISCLLFGIGWIANKELVAEEPKRIPWTTSRVEGSPEPPHPYKVERAFPSLTFQNPLLLTMPPVPKDSPIPGANRFFVGEQGGKIFSFPNEQSCAKKDLFLDVATELSWDKETIAGLDAVYGLAFHPKYADNRYCYICYVVRGKKPGQVPEGTRVSRFRVTDANPPRCDPKSEKILITWRGGGHNGGDLHFGNDGYLYISTGDATDPIPPDGLNTGQDISDLLSSILRIDVDKEDTTATPKRNYAIPPDNPFLKTPKARPEVWAYGFRNPWRMSFDRPTGDLWVGDVGWELWEMIYRVKSGGNYGWSVMEGPQPVRPESTRGPTPISPPAIALEHTEAASITGGVVYRGKKLKDLYGTYIFGDWVTRKLWGTKFDGEKKVSHQEIAQGNQRVIAFGVDQDQELYFLHHEEVGTLHQLVPNEAVKTHRANFPVKLSETGIFDLAGSSLRDQIPSPGVYPFAINAQRWADHAVAERFAGFPGTSSAKVYDGFVPIPEVFFSGQVFLPKNGVLVKTLSMDMVAGDSSSRRRIETQLLHFDGKNWNAYTYAWNEAQTDADLVPAAGLDRAISVVDPEAPGGKRQQIWHYPSRAQCITCHNPWVGYALAFNPLQLSRPSTGEKANGASATDPLTQLKQLGLIELMQANGNKKVEAFPPMPAAHRLVNPQEGAASLADRARSYLHVNCSHCHQPNAGGSVVIDLRKSTPDGETKTVGINPVKGAFDIPMASIISPGDPYRSTLYYRMAKTGPGHMPHMGSELVDARGLALVHDWIGQIPNEKKDPEILKQRKVLAEQMESVLSTESRQKGKRKDAITSLLASTSGALMLSRVFDTKEVSKKVPGDLLGEILLAAKTSDNAGVRDLFERFMPEQERVKRLGTSIQPERLLALKGDIAKGRELFFKAGGLQCASCHKIQGTGSTLGPDLSGIGRKYSRAQILESILQPSKTIDPKYATYLVETQDGKVASGLLASRTEKEVVLRTAQDKEIRIDPKQIVSIDVQKTSQMPEMLLKDLTAEQAASLVDFLASMKGDSQGDATRKPTKILVHYMPWFQAKPFSPNWGWHWTMNVFQPDKRSGDKREIASHYQPLVGPYDSGDPDVLEYHALTMRLAGIDGVILDWYGLTNHLDYAANHKHTLAFIEKAIRAKLQFAICYEDQTISKLVKDGLLQESKRLPHAQTELEWMKKNWFQNPSYVRMGEKPLLLSFGNDGLTEKEWKALLSNPNDRPLYLSEHELRDGADGVFDWPVPARGVAFQAEFIKKAKNWGTFMPVAYPRFRDIYQQAKVHDSFGSISDDSGKVFEQLLKNGLEARPPLIQICTWNDWGEGTMIEPSREFGFRDLETVQKQRRTYLDPGFSVSPGALRLPLRLYELRVKFRADPDRKKKLDQIAEQLANLSVEDASRSLERLEKHP